MLLAFALAVLKRYFTPDALFVDLLLLAVTILGALLFWFAHYFGRL